MCASIASVAMIFQPERASLTTFAVLASGPSMSQELADSVRGRCRVVAVSDVFRLAPWADALVAHDACWWEVNREAREFAGRKFSGRQVIGIERLPFDAHFGTSINSGLEGMRCAKLLGATKILLCGFDLSATRGAHYFGEHPVPLRNTTPRRFRTHILQFRKWSGPPVLNCTAGSALKQFPFSTLEQELGIQKRSAREELEQERSVA